MIIFIILVIILIFFYIYPNSNSNVEWDNEKFQIYWYGPSIDNFPQNNFPTFYDHTDFPFDNMRMGQTSNMSYDLRGDPIKIKKYPQSWNYSTLTPIYNKKLC